MQAWIGKGWRAMAIGAALLLVCAAGLVWVSPTEAQGQTLRLVSPPAVAQPQDTIHVMVSNLGQKPVRVTSVVVDAADLTPIEESDPEMVRAGTTFFSVVNSSADPIPFLALVQVRSAGRASIRVSLQVVDATGHTQIFTDGFESGDTSS